TDGEALESPWHWAAIVLLVDSVRSYLRGRTDFFAGGNMFFYYSEEQARNREYRGPDFFFGFGALLPRLGQSRNQSTVLGVEPRPSSLLLQVFARPQSKPEAELFTPQPTALVGRKRLIATAS